MLSNPFVLSVLVGLGAALFLYGIYHVRQPAELRRRVRSAFEDPAQSYEQLELQTTFSERVMQPLLRRILASASRFAPAAVGGRAGGGCHCLLPVIMARHEWDIGHPVLVCRRHHGHLSAQLLAEAGHQGSAARNHTRPARCPGHALDLC